VILRFVRPLLVAVMFLGSLIVATTVFSSVAVDTLELARNAGWYALIALAWPAMIFLLARRS
jgi:hypothetical protein